MKPALLVLAVISAAPILAGEVILNESYALPTAPRVDGNLDEPAWRQAARVTELYRFLYKPFIVSPMKTVLLIGHTDKALYLGLQCYEPDMSKVRAAITQRDDQNIWKDDNIEIYIDPASTGYSYFKLFTNPLGTRGELRVLDGANYDVNWSPDQWRVGARRLADRWEVEIEIPWSVLEAKPAPGDVWTFALIRMSYTSGKLAGATTSPGTRHGQVHCFGYLVFGRQTRDGLSRLARGLAGRERGRWSAGMAHGVLTYEDYALRLTELADRAARDLALARKELDRAIQTERLAPRLKTLQSQLDDIRARIPAPGKADRRTYADLAPPLESLATDAENLRWDAGILRLASQ